MEREIDLKKISDGKLYTNKDMVKAGCGECQGCSDCCRGMGNSIFNGTTGNTTNGSNGYLPADNRIGMYV